MKKTANEDNPMLELVSNDKIICVSKMAISDSRLRKAWGENPNAMLRMRTEDDAILLARKFVETISPLFEEREKEACIKVIGWDDEILAVKIEGYFTTIEIRSQGNGKELSKAIGEQARAFGKKTGRDMTFAELKRTLTKR